MNKYLGMSAKAGGDRSDCFQHLIDIVCRMLADWKEEKLSFGEKVLIKDVAHAILAYAMSIVKLPAQVCEVTISFYVPIFVAILRSTKMYALIRLLEDVPKNHGGMGFRNLWCFNKALLAKQWCVFTVSLTLRSTILKTKYFTLGGLLNTKLKKGSSYTWQSIWEAIQTFGRGYI